MSAPAALARLKIWKVLQELEACLCRQLGKEAPCFCGIVFGEATPVEYVGCEGLGAGYIRVLRSYPSSNFPEPDVSFSSGIRAYDIAVGVIRLAPYGEGMEPPEPDAVRAHSEVTAADMQSTYEAICCVLDLFEDMPHTIAQYQPVPNQGGIDGGEWLLTISDDL